VPLLLIAVVVGFLARLLRNQSTAPLVFQRFWLLGIAAGLQVALVPRLRGSLRTTMLFLTIGMAVVWLAVNIVKTSNTTLRWSLVVIAAGTFMNVVPTFAYGAMPVDGKALRSIGVHRDLNPSAFGAKHVEVNSSSAQFFGDRFPIRPLHCVASLGDFVEMFGIALLISGIPKRSVAALDSPSNYGPLTT
jgi:predicted membrane channel-forming protein YqfA (hemolysin III family)